MQPQTIAATVLLLVAFCLAYGPDIPRGFVRDDFRWVRVSRIGSLSDLPRLLFAHVGFY